MDFDRIKKFVDGIDEEGNPGEIVVNMVLEEAMKDAEAFIEKHGIVDEEDKERIRSMTKRIVTTCVPDDMDFIYVDDLDGDPVLIAAMKSKVDRSKGYLSPSVTESLIELSIDCMDESIENAVEIDKNIRKGEGSIGMIIKTAHDIAESTGYPVLTYTVSGGKYPFAIMMPASEIDMTNGLMSVDFMDHIMTFVLEMALKRTNSPTITKREADDMIDGIEKELNKDE